MALSTLLVADFDSDAPNTAMAETRASPTIRAAAVCAVRRGLRMEFSRPSRPEIPSRRASGRPITLAMGRATAGASMATPTKISTAPRPTSAMAGCGQPEGEREDPDQGDDAAPDEAAPQWDLVLGLLLGDRRHRGDAHGAAGRADGRDQRHADTHHEADDDGARLEDERARRQRDAEAAQQLLEPDGGQHAQAEADQRRHQPHDGRLAEDGAEHLAPARPHDAQQRQLPRALAHDDGERVQDGEAADEERDEGEDEQGRVEEAQRLADGARRLVDHGLAGDHLDAVRQDAARWRAGRSPCRRRAWRRR